MSLSSLHCSRAYEAISAAAASGADDASLAAVTHELQVLPPPRSLPTLSPNRRCAAGSLERQRRAGLEEEIGPAVSSHQH